jgi:hypothetical protein
MTRHFISVLLLPALFFSSCNLKSDSAGQKGNNASTNPMVTTIIKALPDKISARPDKGFIIRYRWEVSAPDINDSVIVRIVNQDGEEVLKDDHNLPAENVDQSGSVEYSRVIVLPVWNIVDKKTVSAVLPEGHYSVHAGLYDKINNEFKVLKRGKGVKKADENLYRIAVLDLDPRAPVPLPGEKTLDLTSYKLTFDEEFNDLSVSAWGPCGEGGTRWIAHTPWKGDFGDAKFTDPEQGFPFTIENGILRIEASRVNGQWRSGLLSAVDSNGNGFTQQLGYFECKAKLPQGPGTWPAFWLMGKLNLKRSREPRINPEVDVIEHYGHWPNQFSFALHLWGRGGLKSKHQGKRIRVFGVEDDYHTYGILIDENYMILYFDGIEVHRIQTPDGVKVPLYPIVNLGLGPGWPTDKTPDPCYMYVDYIKVYSK